MFGFIAFTFKLFFSTILGFTLSYITNSSDDEEIRSDMVNTAMVSIFATSLMAVIIQFPESFSGFLLGGSIFSIFYVTNSFVQKQEFKVKLRVIFASIIGIIIGIGYILQAIILLIVLYIVLKNSNLILQNFNYKEENENSSDND